jgi:hypothetical protein
MPTPQFHRPRFHRDSLPIDSSFDATATPPWLMLPSTSGTDFVNLDNAAGLVVKSRNENIADFDEPQGSSNNNRRELMINGKSPGVTFIDVFAPNSSTAVITKLEVSVKDRMVHTIAFHLVTDGLINTTTRTANSVTILHNVLNNIYERRANLNFNMTRVVSVDVNTYLLNIVIEQERGGKRAHREWDKLVAVGDPNAEINVFFMPWEGTEDRRPSQMLVSGGDFVCEDGMSDEKLKVALPHVIGSYLGCPVDYNDRHKDYMMFESHAEGLNGGSFIPKNCVNTMNPD